MYIALLVGPCCLNVSSSRASALLCSVCLPIIFSSSSVVGYISLALKSPSMYIGPLFFLLFMMHWRLSYAFCFSSWGLSAGGMYVMAIVVSIVPLSVKYISLSSIGSMSFTYCMNLLLITIATPAVHSCLPPSPLKNHVYCFLVSLVFWFPLVSVSPSIIMLCFIIHFSTSSLTPGFLVPLMFSVAILYFLPSCNFILSLLGS